MGPQERYFIARTQMAERVAEAQRARLVRGDRNTEDLGASMAVEFGSALRHGLMDRLRSIRASKSAQRNATA